MVAVMMVVGIMRVSVIALTQASERSYLSANANTRAYYLADSGLRYAQTIFCEDDWRHGRTRRLRLDSGDEVEIIRLVDTFWATAEVDVGTPKEARALVPMPLSLCGEQFEANPLEEFAIFGDVGISLGNNTIIRGDVAITGDNIDIQGDVVGAVLAKNIEFTGQGTVTGDIFASGFVDIRTGGVIGDIHAANGITLRSTQATAFDGWLFSNASVALSGRAAVGGHVHACGGDVSLSGSSSIGTPENPAEVRASGNVTLSGSTRIYGDVHAGGSVIMGGGVIIGNVYAAGTISSGSISGLRLPNSPTFVESPICPDLSNVDGLDLPEATDFSSGGPNVNINRNSSATLNAGSYGDLSTRNNSSGSQMTFSAGSSGHSDYFFESVDLGNSFTIRYNLSGGNDIRIFVEGDIDISRELNILVSLNGINYFSINDPAIPNSIASRVYWESTGDYDLGNSSDWFGAVFTPDGSLSVSNGSLMIGSFFSGGGHNIQASTVVHVPPNYFSDL
ncbi:hypothetical protein OAE58_00450 [Akkermansiaceae bacterium]|nr:hypothetical protein [bacterium]MDB4639505.1 hypothetical protein [Akkermansiaceae bacterium]MDB4300340.1 hypothetical protein [bacterium]MDB4728657.1 hypothetical protein [Akkermansiaceae bacterium]MDB4770997.1 hypothetical protein [Akkermansiaceae bacterium]